MIYLNILKNVANCLFKYFVSHIMTHVTMQQDKLKFILLHNFTKCFSGTRVNQIVIINICMANCLSFSICYFRLGKKCLQNLYSKIEWSSTKNFLRLWHCQIIWYLFESFKTIMLCSVRSIRFVKYVLSAKIWFMKTSTRIVKYESRVVRLNSVSVKSLLKENLQGPYLGYLLYIWFETNIKMKFKIIT